MEKVNLPKDVADILNDIKERNAHNPLTPYGVLKTFERYEPDYLSMTEIMQALVNGYEVEETPENKVREYFSEALKIKAIKYESSESYIKYASKVETVVEVLNLLNIKIDGVNT